MDDGRVVGELKICEWVERGDGKLKTFEWDGGSDGEL
jgi:hypothetical protein